MADSSSAPPAQPNGPPERPSGARFGVFEIDFESAELRKRGLRVRLQEQPFRVLSLLLEQPGRVVTREELQSKLWPGDTFVDFDHGLNTAVNKIRQALGDSAANPRFIETMHRRGYRFIAPVEWVGAAVEPATATVERLGEGSGQPPAGIKQSPAVTGQAPVSTGEVPADAEIPTPPPAEAPASPNGGEVSATPTPESQLRPGAGITTDPSVQRWFKVGGAVILAVTVAFAVFAVMTVLGLIQQRLSSTSEPERLTPAMVNRVRILAGQSSDYVSPSDEAWSRDRYYVGGETTRRNGVVIGAEDTNLFLGERYGRFQYVIPAAPREYTLTLHFAETWFGAGNQGGGGPGSRIFDVECNGTYLLRNFDVFREAGGANRAITRSFEGITPNDQGHIVITFLPRANNGMINALELVPAE